MTMNVQSVVTNGAAIPATPKASRKIKVLGTTAIIKAPAMTLEQACEIGFKAGEGLASLQDSLAVALTTFKGDETALTAIRLCMVHGYMVKNLGYTRDHAKVRAALLKHNPDKTQDDKHRTFEEERCVTSVNVLMYRARKLTGTEQQDTPEKLAERKQNAAVAKANKDAKDAAFAIVHPKDDVDIFEAMRKLVSTMRAIQNKHSAKLQGDAGMAWRDWLAAAPKA